MYPRKMEANLAFCTNMLRYSPNYIKNEDIDLKDKEPLG